ncbi:MAG TPA: thioredoxin-dependent thiol peroxidase [Candidatus Binataceae bacterium]|nr:thioredoxin-dependent thiol peroxidase [Candidatus Binataceae bacterium]
MSQSGTARNRVATPTHPLLNQPAPDFELPDAQGERVKLGDLHRTGWLVLYFYPKDMTPGCTTQACTFNSQVPVWSDVRIVGISGDSPASHQKFAQRYQLAFTLLSDTDHHVAEAYGVYKRKSLYGHQFMGIERTTFLIDRAGRVRQVFAKVKVQGHAEAVAAALAALKDRP